MRPRVVQPRINPSARSAETRDWWSGLALICVALLFLVCGVTHITGIDTLGGTSASEWQLMKAFSNGGLRYSDALAVRDPSILNDPVRSIPSFEQRQQHPRNLPRLTYRVDAGATTPCPT